MTEVGDLTQRTEIIGVMSRFTAVRDLGRVVINLERQKQEIHTTMDMLIPSEDAVAPDGMVFLFNTTHPEDPMDIQLEVPEYHNETSWSRLFPHDYTAHKEIRTNPDGTVSFLGHQLSYDQRQKKIWIYNKTGWLRAEYRDGIRFSGLIEDHDS